MKIKKEYYPILVLLLLIPFSLHAQKVITSSGGYGSTSGANVTWTVGETITETLTGSTVILTQGFNQGNLVITVIKDTEENGLTLKVFPNPASDMVTIASGTTGIENLRYILSDTNGRILMDNILFLPESQFSVSGLKPAIYFLKIFDNKKEIGVYKIVKK